MTPWSFIHLGSIKHLFCLISNNAPSFLLEPENLVFFCWCDCEGCLSHFPFVPQNSRTFSFSSALIISHDYFSCSPDLTQYSPATPPLWVHCECLSHSQLLTVPIHPWTHVMLSLGAWLGTVLSCLRGKSVLGWLGFPCFCFVFTPDQNITSKAKHEVYFKIIYNLDYPCHNSLL